MAKTVKKLEVKKVDKKKNTKEEYDVAGIIAIDDKKKGDDFDLGREDADTDTDDDDFDMDSDFEFDDGGD
jgi:hypothetical protein